MKLKLEDLLTDKDFRRFVLNPNQEDHDVWENSIDSDKENGKVIEEARQIILEFYNPLTPEEFESQAIDFRRRINVSKSERDDIISLYDQRRPQKSLWLKYAAVLAFLLVSISVIVFTVRDTKTAEIVDRSQNIIQKSTTKGQKMTIVFPDGTVVKLNSESEISYPEEFSTNSRTVSFKGEAYFDVAHYDDWPFIVETGNVKTKVLGTSFNISSYETSEKVSIALVEGSVRVIPENSEPINLSPSEMAVINNNDHTTEVTKFDFLKTTGWKDNIIVFDKSSFSEVQHTLERWFDVNFIYEEVPVFEGGYTGSFADQSLEDILKGIGSNKFDFNIKGKKVFIN